MNNLISFEGIDGCGKTTQINLLSNIFDQKNIKHSVIREPGGTEISEEIRTILLNKNNNIKISTETLLFLSARSQMVEEIVKTKLKRNEIVLCDRFIDSTVAYQGFANNLDVSLINKMNLFATDNIVPILTLFFDIDPYTAYARLKNKSLDRMELKGIDFLSKVREGYLKLMDLNPSRIKRIDCNNLDIVSIRNQVVKLIKIHINKEI